MTKVYVSAMGECPECKGEGRLETMTRLTQEGDQSWKSNAAPAVKANVLQWFPPCVCSAMTRFWKQNTQPATAIRVMWNAWRKGRVYL